MSIRLIDRACNDVQPISFSLLPEPIQRKICSYLCAPKDAAAFLSVEKATFAMRIVFFQEHPYIAWNFLKNKKFDYRTLSQLQMLDLANSLTTLSLEVAAIEPEDFSSMVRCFFKIHTLLLKKVDDDFLCSLSPSSYNQIRHLSIHGHPFSSGPAFTTNGLLTVLKNANCLQVLYVQTIQVKSHKEEEIPLCEALNNLSISDERGSDFNTFVEKTIKKLPSLHSLSLSQLTPQVFQEIKKRKLLQKLQITWIAYQEIVEYHSFDVSFPALAALELPMLSNEALFSLSRCTALHTLGIRQIAGASVDMLLKIGILFPSLRVLKLPFLLPEVLVSITNCSTLEELHILEKQELTRNDIEVLTYSFPCLKKVTF